MKHISLSGLDVSRIGLGTMAMSGYYLDPTSSDAESTRTIQRALQFGRHPHGHRRDLRPLRERGTRRSCPQRAARRCRGGDEVRLRLARRGWPRGARQQPREHPNRGRRFPEAAWDRPHRPLLPAPGRPEHADREHRRRPGRTGGRGQGPAHRPFRGRPRNDPPRPRRAPDRRAANGVSLSTTRRGGRAATAAARARHRLRAILASLGMASSPERSAPPKTSPTTTGARTTPASPRGNFEKEPAHRRRGRGCRLPGLVRRRPRSRWRRSSAEFEDIAADPRHRAGLPSGGKRPSCGSS